MSAIIRNKQECFNDAARDGIINDVKKYLNDGTVNIDGKNYRGWTALHNACWKGYRDIAELLLDNGANIYVRTFSNSTPLMEACWTGRAAITKLLLDRRCAVKAVDDYGEIALHKACWNGYTECVKELLLAHAGADTTVQNKRGQTRKRITRLS